MDWNCTLTEERLSDYLDHQMTREHTFLFSAHVASCPQCTRLVEQVGGVVRSIQALKPVREPAHLFSKIIQLTTGVPPRERGWRRVLGWPRVIWQPRFAMGAVTAAASLLIVLHFAGVTPGKFKRADLTPAGMLRSANRQAHLAYARGAKFVNDLRVVYEIQSALQRTPPAQEQEPASEPKSESPSSRPEQKSQTEPRPRSQVRSGVMVAALLNESAWSVR